MIKIFRNILLAVITFPALSLSAQTTSSSPYSQFGLGDLKGSLLPQNRAMGGISMGVRKPGPYNNINLANPASYSSIELTTFDVGAYAGLRSLSKNSISENSFNATLSHVTFAVPVSKKSALSFGLLPYSDVGYQFKNTGVVDTNKVEYIYSGDGGVSKAYLGYGFMLGQHLSLGFNAAYLFGNLKEIRSAEFPEEPAVLNSRTLKSRSVGGLNFDYGIQYISNPNAASKLIIGYSGSSGNKINSTNSIVNTRYRKDFVLGNESPALDTTYFQEGTRRKITLPMTHTLGFAFERSNKLLLGVDVNYSKWADYRDDGTNPGFNNSYGIAAGGQFTPDATAVSNYFALVDYRFGVKYDKTYLKVNNHDINQYALTMGLGLPLQSNRSTFYKINFAAELGQRGSLDNSLVRERYVNMTLGFTLNDKWFIKPKFD